MPSRDGRLDVAYVRRDRHGAARARINYWHTRWQMKELGNVIGVGVACPTGGGEGAREDRVDSKRCPVHSAGFRLAKVLKVVSGGAAKRQ